MWITKTNCNATLCYCVSLKAQQIHALIAEHNPQSLEELLRLTGSDQGCGGCWNDLAAQLYTHSRLTVNAA